MGNFIGVLGFMKSCKGGIWYYFFFFIFDKVFVEVGDILLVFGGCLCINFKEMVKVNKILFVGIIDEDI